MPRLTCFACGRQIYTVAPVAALFAEERRCPRCGTQMNEERRAEERRHIDRRHNDPTLPGPPAPLGERRTGERRQAQRRTRVAAPVAPSRVVLPDEVGWQD